MIILFLGGYLENDLANWLKLQREIVTYTKDKVTIEYIRRINPSFIISYNYRHIISKEIIEYVNSKIINLHISYLPYNKGVDPNVWSFLENTPKGVTIHYIDEGLDTGDIIIQKKVYINEDKETLRSSYKILHKEIQNLFRENWNKIMNNELISTPQQKAGAIHFKRDFNNIEPFIQEKGWDTPIKELKRKYATCHSIRSKQK